MIHSKIFPAICFLISSLTLQGAEDVYGEFRFEKGLVHISITNKSKENIIIADFMEGLQVAVIRTKSSPIPVVKNETLIDFDRTNKGIIWWRLRSFDKDFPGLGSEIRITEKISNSALLAFIDKEGKMDQLLIEVTCRTATVDETKLGKFSIRKITLQPQPKR